MSARSGFPHRRSLQILGARKTYLAWTSVDASCLVGEAAVSGVTSNGIGIDGALEGMPGLAR